MHTVYLSLYHRKCRNIPENTFIKDLSRIPHVINQCNIFFISGSRFDRKIYLIQTRYTTAMFGWSDN